MYDYCRPCGIYCLPNVRSVWFVQKFSWSVLFDFDLSAAVADACHLPSLSLISSVAAFVLTSVVVDDRLLSSAPLLPGLLFLVDFLPMSVRF